jgi:hypothetical protein
MSRFYERLADLPLEIEGFEFETHEMDTSAGFTRTTTVVALSGDGETGRGEDVTYETGDHEALWDTRESGELDWNLSGSYTLDSFSTHLDGVDLWPETPTQDSFRHYRRWAVESAALDLALRQAATDFPSALDRAYDPVRFVVSTRLDTDDGAASADSATEAERTTPSGDRVHRWLDVDSSLEFKLDPTSEWDRALCEELAGTGAVRVLDFKNYYEGTDVDSDPDPALYRRVAESFPEAVLEDAKLTDHTRDALAGTEDRLSWDYPITGVESVRELPVDPEWLNIKPSRFGTVESLLETIEYCLDNEITMYGGGQYELDAGREHLHAVASVFYPDTPNDVAPKAYNVPQPHGDVPPSPLEPPADPAGLSWNSI